MLMINMEIIKVLLVNLMIDIYKSFLINSIQVQKRGGLSSSGK